MMSNKTSDQSQNTCNMTADNGSDTTTFFSPATPSGSARNWAQMWTGFSFPNLNERRHLTLEWCHPTAGDAFWQTRFSWPEAILKLLRRSAILEEIVIPCSLSHSLSYLWICLHILNRNLQHALYNAHNFCMVNSPKYSNVNRDVPQRAWAGNQWASLVLSSCFLDTNPERKEACSDVPDASKTRSSRSTRNVS